MTRGAGDTSAGQTQVRSRRVPANDEYREVLASPPMFVVRPGDAAECAAILKAATHEGRRVLAYGAGRHQRAHGVPSADVVMETGDLTGIVDHDVGDQTITVLAGTSLAEVSGAARAARQWLPIDPTGADDATIGGVVSAGVAGPLRTGYGPARDHLLGTEAAYADGEIARSGGRLVKNVTGFDLHRLQHGAHGTLAVLTRLHLRLRPLPDVDRTLVARLDGPGLDRFHAAWRATGANAAAVSAVSKASSLREGVREFEVLVRLMGSARAVDAADGLARSALGELAELAEGEHSASRWRQLVQMWTPPAGGVTLRVTALPMDGPRSRLGEICAAMEDVVGRHTDTDTDSVFGLALEPMAGVVRAMFASPPPIAIVSALLARAELSGVATEDGPVAFRLQVDPRAGGIQVPALQARLKHALDPRGTLSPGRFPFPAVVPTGAS